MTITMMPAIYREKRRGVATMWLLAGLPVLLVLFFFLIELGHLWAARVELENSLEAAALAAVKEWGENGGSPMANWTSTARNRGVTLAGANSINGIPVVIGTNLGTYSDPANPNENLAYLPAVGATGNLVFGTVTEMGTTVTFDATNPPACGSGTLILIDATGSGNLDKGNSHDWGIAFQAATDPALRILAIEIDVATATPAPGRFPTMAHLDTATDTPSSAAVSDGGPTENVNWQQDIRGFATLTPDMTSGQIIKSYPTPTMQKLRFDFYPGPGDPNGFAPGDRFRFAQDVRRFPSGGNLDGESVAGSTITIYFNMGPSISGTLAKNLLSGSIDPAQVSPVTGTLIVHPSLIPDLPTITPYVSQSYKRFTGAGATATDYFGVRAQATISVPSLFGSYLGALYSLHNVTVDTTAIYDCDDGRTRLVRVDNYLHP